MLPLGVVAACAVALTHQSALGRGFPGMLTTSYFLIGAATAASLGSFLDKVHPRHAASACGAVTAVVALPLMWLPISGSAHFVVGAAMAGSAFSLTLPATNALLRSALPKDRLVLGVCVKQAAIPASLLFVGAVAPVLDGSPREMFAVANGSAVVVLGVFVALTRKLGFTTAAPAVTSHRSGGTLLRPTVATLLASLLAGALIGYGGISLHDVGLTESSVARVLAIGSLTGVLARVASGWLVQVSAHQTWWPVVGLTTAGALGCAGLACGSRLAAVLGAFLAYGLGWAWSGLTFALVLVNSTGRSGARGAFLQSGGMLGSALGPILMAGVVSGIGLEAGWWAMSAAMLGASVLFSPLSLRRT